MAEMAPDKRRGKTRDAFALEKIFDKPLFDFRAVYALGEKDLNARPKMKRMCFDGLYFLSELQRRVANHIMRLRRFQRTLTSTDSKDVQRTVRLLDRSIRLTNFYINLSQQIPPIVKNIEYLIEDIDLIDARNFRQPFARRLREARKAAGLTQDELAQRIGVKRSTYGQFEQGRNEPNVSILPKLSRELNRSVEWLLGMTP